MEYRDDTDAVMASVRRKERTIGKRVRIHRDGGLVYLTFPALEEAGVGKHLFSTRLGGVSKGHLGSMNLSYTRGDAVSCVDENFRRIAGVMGKSPDDFVFTHQTHTANVRVATKADRGKGLTRERDYQDVDGLITGEPGIVLSSFFADCVPLYFADPVNRAIGLAHSGWKGTVGKIGRAVVSAMTEQFGSDPADMTAVIGPSICGDCYEVGEDVAEQFREAFADDGGCDAENCGPLLRDGGDGKCLLNLWEANRRILREAGISPAHIGVTDLRTCCNPDFLFSHRASHGMRGNLGAFFTLE